MSGRGTAIFVGEGSPTIPANNWPSQKPAPTGILWLIDRTQQSFDRLTNPGDYAVRVIDKVQLKGKSEWVTIYEVFDADLAEVKAGKLATLQLFTKALSLYNMKSFRQAAELFADCLRQNPADKVARIYLERCN